MRSLLIIRMENIICGPDQLESVVLPETLLEDNGYQASISVGADDVKPLLTKADAVVLDLPIEEITQLEHIFTHSRSIPMLWWCSSYTATSSVQACEIEHAIDGILTPTMKEQELHWALHFAAKLCVERQQWHSERQQLVSRLEDRKWIDMAKGILADMKKISEAEAYDMLRKKAMNDRKRLVDVATAIVKAHQLLQS